MSARRDPSPPPAPAPKTPAGHAAQPRHRSWWRRPWILPLAAVTAAFLAFSLPPYATLYPAQARLPLQEGSALHYPVLFSHILFGTVALVCCCLQVWPRLRRRRPAVHRWSGRLYVFAGVLPSAPLALASGLLGQQGLAQISGNALAALLWFGCTAAGYRAARRRDYARHRVWMVRSFALCFSIVANRVWLVLCFLAAEPTLDSVYGGDRELMTEAAVGASIWLSWVVNLLIAQWWLERGTARPPPPR
ncbi:DUF2306 domain-containing protein [Streptomonospora sediminis]